MMCVKSFVLAVGFLTAVGCTGNVTIPTVGLDHPANPQAAAAPLPPPPTIPDSMVALRGGASPQAAMAGMKGVQGMHGMDHGSMQGMEGMSMAGGAMEGRNHGSMKGMKGMEDMQGMKGMSHREQGDEHESTAAGRPGDEKHVDRTVKVTAFDTMRYKPQAISVKPSETIRFIVTNAGKIRHEFVIATPKEQREHEAVMRQMPNMTHHDPNALTLEPGDTKTLIWQFGNPGEVQFACHEPGHYPAGMIGNVQVGTVGAPSEDQPKMNMDDMQGMGQGSMKRMGQDSMQGMKGMESMHHGQ